MEEQTFIKEKSLLVWQLINFSKVKLFSSWLNIMTQNN